MGTSVSHDIGAAIEVRYCLHGEGEFQFTGVMQRELSPIANFFASLTPEQATMLRHHLTVWLEAMAK